MRKRLYHPLPEDIELKDNVNLASKEKTKKRFYAETVTNDHNSKAAEAIEYIDSFAELLELTAKQFDSLYALYDIYEKEYRKIPLTITSNCNLTAAASIKFFDMYMHAGKTAWEKYLTSTFTPYFWSS